MKMLSDLFGSAIAKGLLVSTLLSFSTSLLMTHLYLGTRDDLASLQSTYRQLQEASKELVESKEKVVIGNQQDDTILLDKIGKIDSLNKEKESLLKRLAAIPKCSSITPNKGSPNAEVNIDGELPVDVISLLNESYNQNKRSSDTSK
jgi:hypothetical protein